MRRGTRIASGYVAVTADGSGINKDIVDSVDEAGPGVEKAGKRHGEDYGENFGEGAEAEISQMMDRLGDKLSGRLSRNINKNIKGIFSDDTGKGIGARLGDVIGQALTDNLEGSIGRMLDDLENKIDKVSGNGGRGSGGGGGGTTAAGANDDSDPQTLYNLKRFSTMFEAARVKLHADANKAIVANDQELLKSQQTLFDAIERANKEHVTLAGKFEEARLKLREQSNDAIYKDDESLLKTQRKLYDMLAAEAKKRDSDMWKVRNQSAKAHYKYLADLAKGAIDERGNAVRRGSNDESSGLGGRVGSLLGAGSRNNALNLFGKMVGGAVTGVENLLNVGKKMFTAFQSGWDEAGEGASVFTKGVSGAGAAGSQALASFAASAPAAVAAIMAVVLAASVLVSVASALLAILTALTSTIVSGLTGAMLVLGGAIAAAAAAGGLLAVAFTSMTDAQRKVLSTSFSPLKDELTGIGQLMITEMIPYFDIWATNLQEALYLVTPVAAVMGQAFGEAGAALTAAASGPGFARFAYMLGVYLPSITTRMTAALGSFLNGTLGVFAALLPMVNRFAGYLAGVTERFSNWANSAQGQNAIVDFVDRAVASLQSLWNFVREFSGFIFDVLFSPEAQSFGDGMFDGLADSFERLREKVSSGDLERWFAEARDFGEQLWKTMDALGETFRALNNAGVLEATAAGLEVLTFWIDSTNLVLGPLVDLMGVGLTNALLAVTDPIEAITNRIQSMANIVRDFLDLVAKVPGSGVSGNGGGSSWGVSTPGTYNPLNHLSGSAGNGLGVLASQQGPNPGPSLASLINSGNSALAATSQDHGGRKPDPVKPKYVNPYKAFAESLIKDDSVETIRQSLKRMNRDVAKALREARKSADPAAVQSLLGSQMQTLSNAGKQGVSNAQSALNSAATSLANATSKGAAAKALRQVRAAQKDLATAIKVQERLNKAAKRLSAQRVVTPANVNALLNGEKVRNATLADYARARERLAVKITAANQKLLDAIALRDDYKGAVTDAAKAFGALTTAQAQTVNGVEQALTATDITTNLQDRLDKIRKFQSNLQVLLAQGLSNSAYKQIVDAGVEGGSAYAQALVDGGVGSISQVNDLVGAYDSVAESLGVQVSDRLYQAGVNAAQGLLDGLVSLDAELQAAATKLGNTIGKAIAKSLGIKSPSRVTRGLMDDVGDGAVLGLDDQHVKVGNAATRLANQIRVSPEVASYASRQGESGTVSGNTDQRPIDLTIITPTEDPVAVAHETINELVGRLP